MKAPFDTDVSIDVSRTITGFAVMIHESNQSGGSQCRASATREELTKLRDEITRVLDMGVGNFVKQWVQAEKLHFLIMDHTAKELQEKYPGAIVTQVHDELIVTLPKE